jgi:hypothetical protein
MPNGTIPNHTIHKQPKDQPVVGRFPATRTYICVITSNHFAKGDLLTVAVERFVGIDGKIGRNDTKQQQR